MKSNEWYTPAKYIEAAREVMGSIDLDPASCELANRTVKATTYYTQEQNGLLLPWYGNIWLNPPYSNPAGARNVNFRGGNLSGYTKPFMLKLMHHFSRGEIQQAIVCVNADTCRTWFQPLWNGLLCFPSPQVEFLRPDGTREHHFYSTVFGYLGTYEQKFIDIFSRFGPVAKRVSPPPTSPTQLLLDTPVSASLPDSVVT